MKTMFEPNENLKSFVQKWPTFVVLRRIFQKAPQQLTISHIVLDHPTCI